MTLRDLLAICKAYRNLGDAIGEQLDAIAEDSSEATLGEQNGNALRIIAHDFIGTALRLSDSDELDEELEDLRKAIREELAR